MKNLNLPHALACYVFFPLALFAQASTAVVPVPRDSLWFERHEGFSKLERPESIKVLFIGDSITDSWRHDVHKNFSRGQKYWEARIAPLGAANFGIGGDRTQHVLWRIQHGALDRISPKIIVVLIGTNNTGFEPNKYTARNSPLEVAEGIRSIIFEIQHRLPEGRILLLALLPRDDRGPVIRDQISLINGEIKKLESARVRFLDLGSAYLLPDGSVSKQLMPDLLHPNSEGYRVWADAIEGVLKEMLAMPPLKS